MDSARKIPLHRLAGPLLFTLALFYLGFHTLNGDRGVYALLKEQRRLEVINAELDTLVAQRKELEHRARLLNSGSLDLDLLDEESRRLLGYASPDEVVILNSTPQ